MSKILSQAPLLGTTQQQVPDLTRSLGTLARRIRARVPILRKLFLSHALRSAQRKIANGRSLKAFALVALSLLLVGCGDSDRSRISGSWKVATAEKLMKQVNAVDDQPAAEPENILPRMQIHFNYSGSLMTETSMGSVATKKYGSWEFLSYDAETKTAKIECFMLDETTEFDVLVDDEKTIRLVPPNMAGLKQKMKFVRQ